MLAHLSLPTESSQSLKYLLDAGFSLDSLPADIIRHSYKESVFFLIPDKLNPPSGAEAGADVIEYLKVRQSIANPDSVRSTYCTKIVGAKKQQKLERKRNLSRQEFLVLLSSRVNSNLLPITRDIEVFTYQNSVYSLEKVKVGGETLKFLRVSSGPKSGGHKIPPFLTIGREITNEPQYSTRQLAQPLK